MRQTTKFLLPHWKNPLAAPTDTAQFLQAVDKSQISIIGISSARCNSSRETGLLSLCCITRAIACCQAEISSSPDS